MIIGLTIAAAFAAGLLCGARLDSRDEPRTFREAGYSPVEH